MLWCSKAGLFRMTIDIINTTSKVKFVDIYDITPGFDSYITYLCNPADFTGGTTTRSNSKKLRSVLMRLKSRETRYDLVY